MHTITLAAGATGTPAHWRAAEAHVEGRGACSGAALGGGGGGCFGTGSTLHNTNTQTKILLSRPAYIIQFTCHAMHRSSPLLPVLKILLLLQSCNLYTGVSRAYETTRDWNGHVRTMAMRWAYLAAPQGLVVGASRALLLASYSWYVCMGAGRDCFPWAGHKHIQSCTRTSPGHSCIYPHSIADISRSTGC